MFGVIGPKPDVHEDISAGNTITHATYAIKGLLDKGCHRMIALGIVEPEATTLFIGE